MAWSEPLGGNKYKLVARDPSKVNRPKKSMVVEVPAEISRSQTKTDRWLTLELAKWEDTVQSGLISSKGKNSKLTFRDFIPKWKKGYADQNMGGYTVKNTMAIVDTRLMEEFGDTRLDKITTLHLVTYFAELTNKKTGAVLATNTKLNIYKAAKSIFDAATDWGVISSNPIDGVKRPGQSKKERKQIGSRKKHYSWTEVEQLLIALYKLAIGWRLYFTGCMLGGFRRGELLRESGSHLKTIQERLRHAKLDMSAEYTHESDIINREVVDKLEVLNPKNIKIAL
ncbi:tyrosine-type recombinase/integrase [Paenibacillus sp. CMAA1364]